MGRDCRFLLAVLILAACPVVAAADEAEDAFQAQFGAEYKKVVASPATTDDAALAAKVLEAARKEGTPPALAAHLSDRAYELGSKHPNGYETAVGAMELLADLAPPKKIACLDSIVEVREKAYRAAGRKPEDRAAAGDAYIEAILAAAQGHIQAGDAAGAAELAKKALATAKAINADSKQVQARLDGFAQRQALTEQVADLKAKVQAAPRDPTLRNQLVRLLVVEMDDPAQANLYVDDSCDEAMRKYVPAATRDLQRTPALAAMELAKWYEGLAAGAGLGPAVKWAMLARTRNYYGRFLCCGGVAEVDRAQAAAAIANVEKALLLLEPARAVRTIREGQWIDLVALVDPARDEMTGSCKVEGGVLVVRGNRLAIPCALDGSYRLIAKFVRTEGNTPTAIALPVGARTVAVVLNHFSGASGLLEVNGPPVRAKDGTLTPGMDYDLDVKVLLSGDKAEITVELNGKRYLQWQGPQTALSVWGGAEIWAPRCPGVAVHFLTTTMFKSLKVQMLTGKALVLR